MRRTVVSRLACWTTLISLAVAFAMVERPVLGADGMAPVRRVLGRQTRHLPARYAQVVDEKQRAEIYKIQDEYQPKIDALQSQVNALKKERDEKISALLTPEQKKQIDAAAAKAKADRKARSKAKALPSDKPADLQPATPTPAAPPAAPVPAT